MQSVIIPDSVWGISAIKLAFSAQFSRFGKSTKTAQKSASAQNLLLNLCPADWLCSGLALPGLAGHVDMENPRGHSCQASTVTANY